MKPGQRKLLILAILALTIFDLAMFGHIFVGISRTLDFADLIDKNSADMFNLVKSLKR